MSLINKMLKDIEARQGGSGPNPRPIFQDLQPARATPAHSARGPLVWVLLAVAVGGGGFFAWTRTPVTPSAPTQVVTAPVPVMVEAVAAPVASEPSPVATPALEQPAAPATPPPAKAERSPEPKAAPPARKTASVAKSDSKSEPDSAARIEKVERPYTPEERAEMAYREAVQLRSQGETTAAEQRLRALLSEHPKHKAARELLAGIQLGGGRWLEGQATLEQGVAQVPAHLPFRFQLARLHLEQGAESQAIALLEQARQDGLADPELLAFLAAIQQRGGRHVDAVKNYRAALNLRAQEGRWWVGLGISLESQQDTSPARDAYRRALDSGQLPANLARYAEDRLKALVTR